MRSIQDIFNTVIESGYYGERDGRRSSPFMCLALRLASCHLAISSKEYEYALAEVRGYVEQLHKALHLPPVVQHNLRATLSALNLPSGDEACLAIYKDWASRPFVSHFPSFIGEVDYTEVYKEELEALGDFDTWLQEQYVTKGDQYANLSQYGWFNLKPEKGHRVTARFRVKRMVTRGDTREVSGMARVTYTQGRERGAEYVPNIELWVQSSETYLVSTCPDRKITEWDYER